METIERIVLKTILNAEQGFNGIIEIIHADVCNVVTDMLNTRQSKGSKSMSTKNHVLKIEFAIFFVFNSAPSAYKGMYEKGEKKNLR